MTVITTPATIATVPHNEHQSPKTRADAIAVRVYCSSPTRYAAPESPAVIVAEITTPATIATVTQSEHQSPKTADAIAVRVYCSPTQLRCSRTQAVIVTDVTTPATIATVTQNEQQSPKTADAIAVRVYCSSDTRCYYIAGCHRDRRHHTCDHCDGDSE